MAVQRKTHQRFSVADSGPGYGGAQTTSRQSNPHQGGVGPSDPPISPPIPLNSPRPDAPTRGGRLDRAESQAEGTPQIAGRSGSRRHAIFGRGGFRYELPSGASRCRRRRLCARAQHDARRQGRGLRVDASRSTTTQAVHAGDVIATSTMADYQLAVDCAREGREPAGDRAIVRTARSSRSRPCRAGAGTAGVGAGRRQARAIEYERQKALGRQ